MFRKGIASKQDQYDNLYMNRGLTPLSSSLVGTRSMPMFPQMMPSPFNQSLKLPTINPVLQTAGIQTLQGSPITAFGNPLMPPPIPLLPPSLFSPNPSLPDLKNPLLSDQYWSRYKNGVKGDYIRGGGLTSLINAADPDKDRLKKTMYRNELLSQMDENKLRKVEQYRLKQLQDEIEEERMRKERLLMENRYSWETNARKIKVLDNIERQERAQKERWHRIDEDKYKYKRFRKGSEPVEAWWLDPHPYDPRRYHGRHYDDSYKKYWSHPSWWNTKDPYPYPPPKSGPLDRDWWWYGDREAPWRKERGYWENGKWVPIDVANQIQERVGKEVERLRGEMNKQEVDLQQQLNQMKKQAADADRERQEAQQNIKKLKENLNNQQFKEDLRHDYIYKQLMNSRHEKEELVKKRIEVLPEVTTFPKIDKVQFRLPEKPSSPYDNKRQIPKTLKFINENGKDSVDKLRVKVNLFDGEYLNQINTRRLDDLKELDNNQKYKDCLSDYLNRETSAAKIKLHESDAKNELMNKDVLLKLDEPSIDNYQTPLKVINKYQNLSSLGELSKEEYGLPTSQITQKSILQSYSKSVL